MGRYTLSRAMLCIGLCGLLSLFLLPANAVGDETASDSSTDKQPEETRTADAKALNDAASSSKSESPTSQLSRKTSLNEVLEFATNAYDKIDREIKDYTCILLKREYVSGEVTSWQAMDLKIRHERKTDGKVEVPLSVYLRFRSPERVQGRSVIYVKGRNLGDLIARRGGPKLPNMTVQLQPTGPMAMEGNRYPITEIGFKNLARRVIEVMEDELVRGDCVVEVWDQATVDNRRCRRYLLTHPERKPEMTYYSAEVWVDTELGIPIYYKATDFPKKEGGPPQLLEQYAYKKVRINVGLTDEDFDHRNPEYGFQLRETLDEAASRNAEDGNAETDSNSDSNQQ